MKLSEAFEGESSSLRKAFDNATMTSHNEAQKTNEEIVEEFIDRPISRDAGREEIKQELLEILTLKDEAHRKEMEEAHQRGFELGMNTAEEQHTGRVVPDVPTKEVTEELPTNH